MYTSLQSRLLISSVAVPLLCQPASNPSVPLSHQTSPLISRSLHTPRSFTCTCLTLSTTHPRAIMGQATEELLIPFLGALQASVAVLLTILAGVIASQFQLIGIDSSKEISKVAVRLFLPALLIVNVGSQLHSDTVSSCCNNTYCRRHTIPTTPQGRPLYPHHHLVHLLPTRLTRNRRNSNKVLQTSIMGHPGLRLQQHHQPASPPGPISRCSRHPVKSRQLFRRRRPRQILLPRERHDLKLLHLCFGPQIPRLPR